MARTPTHKKCHFGIKPIHMSPKPTRRQDMTIRMEGLIFLAATPMQTAKTPGTADRENRVPICPALTLKVSTV